MITLECYSRADTWLLDQFVRFVSYEAHGDYQRHANQVGQIVGFTEPGNGYECIILWANGQESHTSFDNLLLAEAINE